MIERNASTYSLHDGGVPFGAISLAVLATPRFSRISLVACLSLSVCFVGAASTSLNTLAAKLVNSSSASSTVISSTARSIDINLAILMFIVQVSIS